MGNVVNGTYQVSFSSWSILDDPRRINVLDWCNTFYGAGQVLATNRKQPQDVDFSLYIRPFSNGAWLCIGLIFTLLSAAMVIPSRCNFRTSNSHGIIEASAWYCFVLVSAYYSGALTMFFAANEGRTFSTTKEVINAFPGKTDAIIYAVQQLKVLVQAT